MNGGDFWWDGIQNAEYEFPINSGNNALFAGAIWLSALDTGGNLKVAAMTYRNQGYDFYPGPINSVTGTVDSSSCSYFNRFWELSKTDVDNHMYYVNLGLPVALSNISNDILFWPAKGNAHITDYNITDDLAPFFDYNNNDIYDPENGDYPLIKGNQSIFWVVNDIGGPHGRTGGAQMGVEVQFMAYSFINDTLGLNNATLYDVKVIKKTPGSLNNFYFGLFVDPDLGDYSDDYVGCDTVNNMGYTYNGNIVDAVYGHNTPVISTIFLNQKMTSFNYFVNAVNGPLTDPLVATEFRNFMTAQWRDGSHFVNSCIGYGAGIFTNYILTGNPSNAELYSECSCNNTPNDKRYLQCSGGVNLNYMDEYQISFGVFATLLNNFYLCQPNAYSSFIDTLCPGIFSYYEDTIQLGNRYYVEQDTTGINKIDAKEINIYPNPVNEQLTIDFKKTVCNKIQIYSITGAKVFDYSQNDLTGSESFNLKDLSSGIYVVELSINNQKYHYKILKD